MKHATRLVDGTFYPHRKRDRRTFTNPKKTNFFHRTQTIFIKLLGSLDLILRLIVGSLIGGYQRYISPRKGYSCAHRIMYGGASCSTYVKQTLADKSLFETTLLARQRFKECALANIDARQLSTDARRSSAGPAADCDPDMVIGCCAALGIAEICKESGR